jgi:hypothetical protein
MKKVGVLVLLLVAVACVSMQSAEPVLKPGRKLVKPDKVVKLSDIVKTKAAQKDGRLCMVLGLEKNQRQESFQAVSYNPSSEGDTNITPPGPLFWQEGLLYCPFTSKEGWESRFVEWEGL